MRDHKKLKAFQLADKLALDIYRCTSNFPKSEQFGLTAQIRKAAVSVPSNIVEGCARSSEADYIHFLVIAFASARELEYQLSLAIRLNFFDQTAYQNIESLANETTRVLAGLIRSFKT
jgi:four helix bundle protein